jgi:hypothetical protein
VSAVPPPESAAQALGMLKSAMGYLSATDATAMAAETQAQCQQTADAILLTAARAGADMRDLAGLAGEIYARSLPEDADGDQDEAFEDRSVKLETTFDGAGVLSGDLPPECATVVGAVLDALSAPAGAEDDAARPSGITMRSPRRCSGWSPPGCCPSGPDSR